MTVTLKRFVTNARVEVVQVDGVQLFATGTVSRIRSDGTAFVALDKRSPMPVHPFPETDRRGTSVLVRPEWCRPIARTRGERRKARRLAERQEPTIATWGKDHWSTFAYVETRVVDHDGVLDRRHMRCDPRRHPLLAHLPGPTPPTRLRDGALLSDHDDWDCLDDLCGAGLLENIGSGVNPIIRMTDEGRRVAASLRAHKSSGGQFATFSPA